MSSGPCVRLVLPHQLFDQHLEAAGDTVFVLIEHDLLFRQYAFHSHKLVLHRASLSRFARRLSGHGFEVEVLSSDAGRSSHDQLAEFVRSRKPVQVTWFDVVDDWLEQDLFAGLAKGGYQMRQEDVLETPNFLTGRQEIDDWFSHNDSRMQDFYVWQRRRLNVLLDDDGEPRGGKWSFDTENRKKLPRGYTPHVVGRFARHPVLQREGTFDLESLMGDADRVADKVPPEVDLAIAWVKAEFPDAPGDPHLFAWPTSGEEAREHL